MKDSKMRMWTAWVALAFVSAVAPGTAFAQGDAGKGEKKFEDCATCHSLKAGDNGVGPSLNGVIGRKAAELGDFRYSPAMRRSGLVWNVKVLDDFLADPQKIVAGNRMPYAGMPDAGERADLIAYLQKTAK